MFNLFLSERQAKVCFCSMSAVILFFGVWRRNRVIARTTPGMTPEQTADSEIYSFYQAVCLDGFNHVLRASRTVATDAGKQRRNEFLIKFNAENQQMRERMYQGCFPPVE